MVRYVQQLLVEPGRPADALRSCAAEVVLHGLEGAIVDSSLKVAEHASMGRFADAEKAAVVTLGGLAASRNVRSSAWMGLAVQHGDQVDDRHRNDRREPRALSRGQRKRPFGHCEHLW